MPKVGCVCGAVSFHVTGPLKAPDACHCTLCRKWSGHFFVSTDISKTAVTLQGADWLTWYLSSPKARRGFSSICGSTLFLSLCCWTGWPLRWGRLTGQQKRYWPRIYLLREKATIINYQMGCLKIKPYVWLVGGAPSG
jgi:hypothetical protein